MRVTVTRPFLVGGQRQEVGTTLDVADALGRELVALKKAAPAGPSKPAGAMTTKTAAAVVTGSKPAAPADGATNKD